MDYHVDFNFLMDQKLIVLHKNHNMKLEREFGLFEQNYAIGQGCLVE